MLCPETLLSILFSPDIRLRVVLSNVSSVRAQSLYRGLGIRKLLTQVITWGREDSGGDCSGVAGELRNVQQTLGYQSSLESMAPISGKI